MEILSLYEIRFDSSENQLSQARYKKLLSSFYDGEETAAVKCQRFLANLKPDQVYRGWDGEVYPQYVVEKTSAA